jgi:SAM-dependent methyltransferase
METVPVEDLEAHYRQVAEGDRLFLDGEPRLELVRTMELLDRHLPPPPARVCDVGGGPGTYASILARRGYDVVLIDAVPSHVEQALERGGFEAHVGDARSIELPSSTVDVVLLLGPLYHLVDAVDRRRALEECRRVMKPAAVLAAAAISKYRSLLGALLEDDLAEPEFWAIARRDVADGFHHNPDPYGRPEWFVDSHWHAPDELRAEIESVGFSDVTVYGVEGPGWPLERDRWDDPATRERVIEAARLTESAPSVLGMSTHLLAIARS